MVDISRGTTGVNLPPAVASEIWGETVEASAVMQAARQITLPGSGVSVPVVTGDATAEWVGETDEKPVSRPTLGNKEMTPYKLAVIVPFSNEFKRDLPGLYAELVRRLPSALGRAFDSTVFGAQAAPGSNFDTLAAAPDFVIDGTDTFADAAAVLAAVSANGGVLTDWVVKPSLHSLLLTTTNAAGQQVFVPGGASTSQVGNVFGAPVYVTRGAMGTNYTGIAGDFKGSAVWGSVQGVQVSFSDQATLTDGEDVINLWQRNMSAVRAEIEVGFRVKDINDFARIGATDLTP